MTHIIFALHEAGIFLHFGIVFAIIVYYWINVLIVIDKQILCKRKIDYDRAFDFEYLDIAPITKPLILKRVLAGGRTIIQPSGQMDTNAAERCTFAAQGEATVGHAVAGGLLHFGLLPGTIVLFRSGNGGGAASRSKVLVLILVVWILRHLSAQRRLHSHTSASQMPARFVLLEGHQFTKAQGIQVVNVHKDVLHVHEHQTTMDLRPRGQGGQTPQLAGVAGKGADVGGCHVAHTIDQHVRVPVLGNGVLVQHLFWGERCLVAQLCESPNEWHKLKLIQRVSTMPVGRVHGIGYLQAAHKVQVAIE